MKYYALLILSLLTLQQRLFAQSHSSEAGLQTDNDAYLLKGSDKYYTNGIFLYYRHALPVKPSDTSRLTNKVLGFELGQKMFNPQSAFIPASNYVDRPFAGYMYAGANLNLLYTNESNLKLGAQIGVVGPAALGKEAQQFIHRTFGFYAPSGWRYQIENDYELNLSADYTRLLARANGIDLSFNAYGNLGNGFTGAGLGPIVRAGLFNRLFNSVTTQSTAIANSSRAIPLHKFELFAYYKPLINYVGYDATIQGSLYRKHPVGPNEVTLTPERWLLSQQFGLAYAGPRWVFDAAAVYHTKDVTTMFHKHQWGTFTALYRFR